MLELTQHLERKPSNLSGGQRQRVAMGRAIVRAPKAFLMDEPLSNLDAKLRVQMRTQVSRIQKSLGTTTLYVTHDQTEAMTLGDRVVVMKGGVVQQVGSPTYLYEHPVNLFVAGFIGSPSMNFLPGTLKGGGVVQTALGETQLDDRCRQAVERSKSSGNVIMGIRPEHFEDASLVGDKPGGTFDAPVDIVEAMGSDVYAYFVMKGEEAHSAELDELAKDTGNDLHSDGVPITARLDAASHVTRGRPARLWYDTSKVALFDAETGLNLAPGEKDETTASGAQRA
jgi:multiple sugar transport system ATP-binding protein